MARRRDFLESGAAGLAAAIMSPDGPANAAQAGSTIRSGGNNRILLKGGTVLTLDRTLGDFETADVLIEGAKIAAVGRNLKAEAQTIDAQHPRRWPPEVEAFRPANHGRAKALHHFRSMS